MRAHGVVILHVALEDMPKVLLVCHQDVVQAFPPYRADQALDLCVLPWRARRCGMIANAKRLNPADEYIAVASIPIADQMARNLLPAAGGRQLIGDPFCRRMRRDSKSQILSPVVATTCH